MCAAPDTASPQKVADLMSHYNLYAALGLDRAADCSTLAAELTRRIDTAGASNPIRTEEIRVARDVLGDPERRRLYDRQLDDPQAPDITVAAIRQLALQPGAETALQGPAPGAPHTQSAAPTGSVEQKSRKTPAIAVVAVVAIIAVAAVLIVWRLTSSDNTDSVAVPPTVTRTLSPEETEEQSTAPEPSPTITSVAEPTTTEAHPTQAPVDGPTIVSIETAAHNINGADDSGLCKGRRCDRIVIEFAGSMDNVEIRNQQTKEPGTLAFYVTAPSIEKDAAGISGKSSINPKTHITGITGKANNPTGDFIIEVTVDTDFPEVNSDTAIPNEANPHRLYFDILY